MIRTKSKQKGFTIVELLIVIVVIGILASITIVAYNGIQVRARDTIRMNDLTAIKKALILYNIDNGNWMESGSGCGGGTTGHGEGWFNHKYTSSTTSLNDCLKNAGYINKDIVDPSGCLAGIFGSSDCPQNDVHTYMKYHCGSGDSMKVFVYANLESRSQSATATDGTCSSASTIDELYGMNYYLQVR